MDYKFSHNNGELGLEEKLFKHGLVVARDVIDKQLAMETGEIILKYFKKLTEKHGIFDCENNSNCMSFMRSIESLPEIQSRLSEISKSQSLLNLLEKLLGPDISTNLHNSIMINDPEDTSQVTNKKLHQEYWTGQVSDDLSVWAPLSQVDEKNTLYVIPGSHFYGILPNRNRELLPIDGFEVGEGFPLSNLGPGDVVIFHFLLLHGTAGRSEKQRVAMVRYYKPTYSETSMKQKAKGVVPVRNGALTRIREVLGNDSFSALRTYGGPISNDARLFDLSDVDISND